MNRMHPRHLNPSLAALVAALAALLLATAGPAVAGDGDTGYGTDHSQNETQITGQQQQQHVDDLVHDTVHNGTYTPPTEWPEYRYVPTCSANGPENGADALCNAAVSVCRVQGHPVGTLRFWVYQRTVYADGRKPTNWKQVGTVCKEPDEELVTTPVVTTEMVVEVARAMTPVVEAHVEPAARSYVNVPNNYYADAPSTTRTVHLFGHAIVITFTAGDPQWDFGDGSSGAGSGIQGASVGQEGAVEHAYSAQGSYAVTVSAGYQVSFTLPNGQDVTQQLTGRAGPAAQLDVGEVQTQVTGVS